MNSYSIPHIIVAAIITGLGVFTYLKNRRAPVNRWFALFCLSVSLWYGGFGVAMNVTNLRAHFFLEKIAHTGVIFGPPIYCGLALRLLHPERFRVALFLCGAAAAIIYWLMWTTNLYFTGEVYRYPWGIYPRASILITANIVLTFLVALNCFVLFPRVCRQAKQQGNLDRYNQMKYLCVALVVIACTPIDYLPKYGINVYPFGYVFGLLFALITAYAIVKHHVMDINVVFQKGLAYSILVAGITLAYLVSVLLAEKLFQGILGYRSLIVTLVAAVIIATGFIPLKNLAENLVNRVFNKKGQAALAEENERLKQELVRSEKLKAVSAMAAGMAHEIKNPLTAIQTFAEFIPERHHDPEFAKKLHEVLTREAKRMQELTQELLTFAKPKEPQLQPVDLAPLIASTLTLLSSNLSKRRVEWSLACNHNGTAIHADPDQLRQVLINLIQNAADAMPGGGQLKIATRSVNSHLELTVSDTGSGIPSALLPKIFDPFITTKPDGNGLGLAMVYSMIQAHHGSIRANSTPGHGATFTVSLPL